MDSVHFVEKKSKKVTRVLLNMRKKSYLCRMNKKNEILRNVAWSQESVVMKCKVGYYNPHQHLEDKSVVSQQNGRIVAMRAMFAKI